MSAAGGSRSIPGRSSEVKGASRRERRPCGAAHDLGASAALGQAVPRAGRRPARQKRTIPRRRSWPVTRLAIFRTYVNDRLGTKALATNLNDRGLRTRTGRPWWNQRSTATSSTRGTNGSECRWARILVSDPPTESCSPKTSAHSGRSTPDTTPPARSRSRLSLKQRTAPGRARALAHRSTRPIWPAVSESAGDDPRWPLYLARLAHSPSFGRPPGGALTAPASSVDVPLPHAART